MFSSSAVLKFPWTRRRAGGTRIPNQRRGSRPGKGSVSGADAGGGGGGGGGEGARVNVYVDEDGLLSVGGGGGRGGEVGEEEVMELRV